MGSGKCLLIIAVMAGLLHACGDRDAGRTDSPLAGQGIDSGRASSGSSSPAGASGADDFPDIDALITTKAKAALLADERVKGSDIDVETKRGEVVLSGSVGDSVQVARAAQLVSRIEGVKQVDNRLKLK